MDEAIVDLQMQLAFQESTIQQLNDVVTDQQQQIDLLRKQLNNVLDQVQKMAPSIIATQQEDGPPPHY